MKLIEEGDFFKLNTENRMEGFELLLDQVKRRKQFDKGRAVQLLQEEEIYKQRKDCKDFIKNVVRCSNLEIVSVSERKISLTGKKAVMSK